MSGPFQFGQILFSSGNVIGSAAYSVINLFSH